MRRGTIFLLLFIVLAAAVIGVGQFLQAQTPREITIAVSPVAEDWVRAAAQAYNNSGPLVNGTRRIRINLSVTDEVALWERVRQLSDDQRPDGWVTALPISFGLAQDSGASITVLERDIAITPLLWGGFREQVAALTDSGAQPLDWEAVRAGSATIRPAFPHPAQTTAGFAVLASAAASFNQTVFLTGASFGPEYRAWIEPVIQAVANYTTLGADVAETMAARGPSVGGVALLPESQWLTNLRGRFTDEATRLTLAQPEYLVVLSFSYGLWNRDIPAEDEADRTAAVRAFGAYLTTPESLALAASYGLRPADGSLPTVSPFMEAATHGSIGDIDPTTAVVLPSSAGDVRRILSWATSVLR